MNYGRCPICFLPAEYRLGSEAGDHNVTCYMCGIFDITQVALQDLRMAAFNERAKISAYIFALTVAGESMVRIMGSSKVVGQKRPFLPSFPYMTIEEILSAFPKSFQEILDRSLVNLSKLVPPKDKKVSCNELGYSLFFIDGDEDIPRGIEFVLLQLEAKGYIRRGIQEPDQLLLTFKGWARVKELSHHLVDWVPEIYRVANAALNRICTEEERISRIERMKAVKSGMEQKRARAFVSYSWDSPEHRSWIHFFVNKLREKGIDADFDQFMTQETTVNLYQMMIKAIRDYDYVVIVLTEKYAQRADSFTGGVGFETLLTLPDLQQNPGKLIFVMRHQGDYSKVFPFHLRGYHAIDFSNSQAFEEKLDELVHRVYKVPLFEKAPLGPIPSLQSKPSAQPAVQAAVSPFADVIIPNVQKITDLDKMEFMRKSFNEMCEGFSQLFDTVKGQVPGFTYSVDEVTSQKCLYLLFLNGRLVSGVKIWLGGLGGYGSQSICLLYGTRLNPNDDGSMNEIISCDVVGNKLKLKGMNFFGVNPEDTIGFVKQIWNNNLANALK